MYKWFLLLVGLGLGICLSGAQDHGDEAAARYVVGQVVEILSEKTIIDEAYQRSEKKIRFKVRLLSGQQKGSLQTLEQSYTQDTPGSLRPRSGRKFIFLEEVAPDKTVSYVLLDIYRLGDMLWLAAIGILLLVGIGHGHGLKVLVLTGVALGLFCLLRWLQMPLLLSSLLILLLVGALAQLMIIKAGYKWVIACISLTLSSILTLGLSWAALFFLTLESDFLFQSHILLSMVGGLVYVSLATVSAIYEAYKEDPTLRPRALYAHGLRLGRRSFEIVSLVLIFAMLAEILPNLYYNDTIPSLMQLEPMMDKLAVLVAIISGLALTLPLSALVCLRLVYRRKI